jgi:hypothetical protein
MRQSSVAEMIGCSLRDLYDAVLTEPLSKRLVDLINRLDEHEGQGRQDQPSPTKSFEPREFSQALRK